MGFKIERTHYRLVFEDLRLNGLTVTARSVSIGEFLRITGMSASEALGGVTMKDTAVVQDPLLREFANVLVSWDLEDEAGPVEPDYEGLASQEPWVVRALVKAWMEAVSGVVSPLQNGSGSPGTLPESSLPMEVSSAPHPN